MVVSKQEGPGNAGCVGAGRGGGRLPRAKGPPRSILAPTVALKGCNFRLGVDTPRKDQAGKYRDLAISLRSADGAKQLDLVCKDRREYKAWATGLAYLCLHGPPAGIAQWRERTSAAARASAVRRQAQGDGTGSAADPALARVASSADPPLGRSGRTLTSRKLRERIRGACAVLAALPPCPL